MQTIIGYDVSFLVGNTLFELNIHENETKEINDSLAHNHYTNELLFVLDGGIEIKQDGNTYVCQKDEILYIPKQVYHISYYKQARFYTVGFSMTKADENKPRTENTYAIFQKVFANEIGIIKSDNPLKECLKEMTAYMRDYKIFSYYLIQNTVRKFFILLTEKILKDGRFPVLDVPLLGSVNALIHQRLNYDNLYDIKLKDLAKELYISERQLARIIKQRYGMPFGKRKAQLRIQSAKEYLTKTDESLESIAFKLYFYDVSAFIQAFKKFTGETPSEYRKKRGIQKT